MGEGETESPLAELADVRRRARDHGIHHNGTANGSTSVFVMLPEFGLSISVMMNRSAGRDGVHSMVVYSDRISQAFITELRKQAAQSEAGDPGLGKSRADLD